jgi:hypothetical protein
MDFANSKHCNSLRQGTRHVYAFTKNGTLTVDGISDAVRVNGIARTSFGRIDVSPADFDVQQLASDPCAFSSESRL